MRITNDVVYNAHPIDGASQPELFWGTDAPDTTSKFTGKNIGTEYWYYVASGRLERYVKVLNAGTANDWVCMYGIIQETVAYDDFTDGGAALGTYALTNTLPAGAIVDPISVRDVTGFAGDTSAVLTVGVASGDVDAYNTGTPSVFATATHIDAGVPSGERYHTAAGTITLHVTSGSDFTSVSAGQLTIRVPYHF